MTVTPDPIQHVVVLMLENHSFDQMLGALWGEIPGLDGVDPAHPGVNLDAEEQSYPQQPTTAPSVFPDPIHETANVLSQLANGNGGFVLDYERSYKGTTAEQRQQIMSYFALGALPALHELARHFTVCDRWFSSLPGPTWPNRFFALSGTSLGRVKMPESAGDSLEHPELYLGYDQDTIFDRLNDAGVTWRVYHGDIPQSLVLSHQRRSENAWRYSFMADFETDLEREGTSFPSFCFIEPSYYAPGQNDDHPPHTTMQAQRLLPRVYNALRSLPELWQSTLFVLLYDEHGGFYDHVVPPAAVPPDANFDAATGFHFDRLGVRVPALLISPWVDATVIHDEFDHTSLLKYLSEKWNLAGLTARVASARNFAPAIRTTGTPRDDTPEAVQVPIQVQAAAAPAGASTVATPEPLNPLQEALIGFARHLPQAQPNASTTITATARVAAPAATATLAARVDAATNAVKDFLRRQKEKAAAGG
jgi:phospholipase C